MKIHWLGIMLICSVPALVVANNSSRKLWIFAKVTKDGDYGFHHISIRNRQVENLDEIEIVIDAKDRPVSPFTSSDLSLNVSGSLVATLPIAEHRKGDTVSYKFRVADSALAHSYLTIDEGAYTDGPDGEAFHAGSGVVDGKPVWHVMGGMRYQLDLANFVPVHTVSIGSLRF